MSRDFSFTSGERQTAPDFAQNRADHTQRYAWAARELGARAAPRPSTGWYGLDLFCGSGYGTWLLGTQGCFTWGIDGSAEAITFANTHYRTARTLFAHGLFPFELPAERFDFITCFESLEHIEEDRTLLAGMVRSLAPGGLLFLSVPNESALPLAQFRECYPFHLRHYEQQAVLDLVETHHPECAIRSWWGQDTYRMADNPRRRTGLLPESEMTLHPEMSGQTLLFLFEKTAPGITS